MRCFIAIECPDDVKDKLISVEREIKDLGSMTLVKRENMHLTLKFLGEVSEDNLKRVVGTLGSLDFKAYPIKVKGIGVFPKPDYARVIWAGVEDGGRTSELAAKVDEAMKTLGSPKEGKFHPHVTIARVKFIKDKAALKTLLSGKAGEVYGEYKVERILLMKSVLSPKGPEYSIIKEIKLS